VPSLDRRRLPNTSTTRTFRNLARSALVQDATALDVRAFLARHGDAALLLVRLLDGDTEVELGLKAGASLSGADRSVAPKPLPFRTTHQVPRDKSNGVRESPRDEPATLEQLIGAHAHFAVPLRKREGSDVLFMDQVSVGRTHNKDIVLRHSSVSKFHAWFEVDAAEDIYVADAGSKNLTRVNGQPIEQRTRTLVRSGDSVRFGAVETVLCAPEALWTFLNKRTPTGHSAP
jgi:hypothetical protein